MNKHIEFASYLANKLDSQFGVGKIRFGYGSLINIVPGIGDSIDALLSFYIIGVAIHVGIPAIIILQMVFNIVINYLIGLIPILGDAYYIIRKVNIKNVELLKKHAPSIAAEQGKLISS